MKPSSKDLDKAQDFLTIFTRIKDSGLIIESKCLNHENRRTAYIAQACIAEFKAPQPVRKPVGFAYKGAK